jgi:hypothetical protein
MAATLMAPLKELEEENRRLVSEVFAVGGAGGLHDQGSINKRSSIWSPIRENMLAPFEYSQSVAQFTGDTDVAYGAYDDGFHGGSGY